MPSPPDRMSFRRVLLIGLCAFLLAGCEEEAPDPPKVEFMGGGFIFNYNVGDAYYGFVARTVREVPPGTLIEAEFENPSGGKPFIVTRTVREGQRDYVFHSPSVEGVATDRDYRVGLRLLESDSRRIIAEYTKQFRSTIDQNVLPKVPATIGPGYQPNPASTGQDQRPAEPAREEVGE